MKFKDLYLLWRGTKKIYVKSSTMAAYELLLNNRILPAIGNIPVDEINTRILQAFLNDLLLSGLSVKSVQDIMIVVKMILRHGAELELIPLKKFNLQYPTQNLGEKKVIETYSNAEQKTIIQYIVEHPSPQNLGILLALCTGMRIGEICALQWKNIDLENRVVKIRSTMSRIYEINDAGRKTRVVFDRPKTIDSNRNIPITSKLYPLLKKYRAVSNADYYVISGSSSPIEPRTYRNHYKNLILNDIGLSRCIKFHGLRHTFATRLVESGAETTAVSKIMGHSNVSITMNLYVHPTMARKAESINKSLKGIF